MGDVIVGVILVLDISLYGRVRGTGSASAYDGGVDATGLLPIDEVSHITDEAVITDDEQVAVFIQGSVFCQRSFIVDEVALIHALEVLVHFDDVAATAFDDVAAVVINLVHLHGHIVIYAEGLGGWVVGERIDGHVLSAEVADNVRLVKTEVAGREESILAVTFAVSVRHGFGVDLAAEVTLGRSNLDAFEVHVLGLDNTCVHAGFVADHYRNTSHGYVWFTGMCGAERLGNGDDVSLTSWGGHGHGVETRDLNVNFDAVLRGRDQLGLESLGTVASDFGPLRLGGLCKGHRADEG